MFFTAASVASAQQLRSIGSFDDVRTSSATGEAHCYGYSVELWTYAGRTIGLLDVHDGLCGDPPCAALTDVAFDGRTGHLTFHVIVRGTAIEFAGTLERDRLTGMLNGERVRFRRDPRSPFNDRSRRPEAVADWCRFWSSVPRCEGVRQLCDTLVPRP